ncbi:MAG: M20/M25/M40 family metallo-hydrolase, partial [Chthoniobacterales bacterium]
MGKFALAQWELRCAIVALAMVVCRFEVRAQEETPTPAPTPPVFSTQTLSELKQLQQAAMSSDYALRQVAHLTNNIGPRLSGSLQAQKAVEYVAAELKAIGAEVQLEKVMVPHWVRGEETAALIEFPGMALNTTQKIVLCALGQSVATPPEGLTAEVVVARNFQELKSLPREKVVGRIVLFNYPFDQRMAAQGRGGEAYSEAVVYRSDGPVAAARQGAVACLV